MSSMQRLGGRGKKSRRLGKVEVVEWADYEGWSLTRRWSCSWG